MYLPAIDKEAKELGATYFLDELYPQQRSYYEYSDPYSAGRHSNIFSRHYFNTDRLEIAYVIPDLEQGLHIFDNVRHWPLERINNLTRLEE